MSAAYLVEDCTVRDDSGAYFDYPEPQTIHKNSKLEFCYDWRLDPLELAAQLSHSGVYSKNDISVTAAAASAEPEVSASGVWLISDDGSMEIL